MKVYVLINEGYGCCSERSVVGVVDSEEKAAAWRERDEVMRDYEEFDLNDLPG